MEKRSTDCYETDQHDLELDLANRETVFDLIAICSVCANEAEQAVSGNSTNWLK